MGDLTYDDKNRNAAYRPKLQVQKIGANSDLQDARPRLHDKPPQRLDNILNIGRHQREGSGLINAIDGGLQKLGVDHGDERTTGHDGQTKEIVEEPRCNQLEGFMSVKK